METQRRPRYVQHHIQWRAPGTLKRIGVGVYRKAKDDHFTTQAAAFAYHTVFAIPALLILTVTVAAVVNRVTNIQVDDHLRTLINDRAPADTKQLLLSIVDNAIAKVDGGGASLGLFVTAVLALWSGSNAVSALVDSFNLAYDVEDTRPLVRKKAITLGLTLALALVVNLAFVLLVFGQRIGLWIADKAGLGGAFEIVWNIGRWPTSIAIVAIILAVLYYAGPDIEQSFRWVSPGSIIATVLWLIAVAGFGIYLRISNPGSAYGIVGSVLVLLFFLYVTGIIFLLGAELNGFLGQRYDPKTINDLAAKPESATKSGEASIAPRPVRYPS